MTQMLVRRTAKELAGSFFEMNRTERFRAMWPDIRDAQGKVTCAAVMNYINRNWPYYVDTARGLLVDMLTKPDVSQHVKDEIEEALLKEMPAASRYRGKAPDHHAPLMLRPDEPGKLEQALFHKD